MLQAIAFVATLIGILVGIIELRRYLSESHEDREFARSLLKTALVLVLLGYGTYFFYFGPKSTGDDFKNALSRLDGVTMYEKSCEGSELQAELGNYGGIISFGGLLVRTTTKNEIFLPVINEYRFDWQSSFGEEEWTLTKLKIKPAGLFEFCVEDMKE